MKEMFVAGRNFFLANIFRKTVSLLFCHGFCEYTSHLKTLSLSLHVSRLSEHDNALELESVATAFHSIFMAFSFPPANWILRVCEVITFSRALTNPGSLRRNPLSCALTGDREDSHFDFLHCPRTLGFPPHPRTEPTSPSCQFG